MKIKIYNSQRNFNLKEGEYNIDIELSPKVKLFNDLIEKTKDDEIYTSKLKKFALSNFYKNNIKEKDNLN